MCVCIPLPLPPPASSGDEGDGCVSPHSAGLTLLDESPQGFCSLLSAPISTSVILLFSSKEPWELDNYRLLDCPDRMQVVAYIHLYITKFIFEVKGGCFQ